MSRSLLTNETSELDLLDQRPFDQTDFDILKSYEAVVDGLAMLIGSHCEIVLHSLQDLKCSAIRIANGEHTGRKIGSPITDLALRMLHTLHRSPWRTDFAALLRLLSEGDELLLLQDGVTAAVDGNRYLESLRNAPIKVYALNEDLIARGLTGRISNDIIPIDYTDFVRLTVKHSSQMAW